MCLPRSLRSIGQGHSKTQVYAKLGWSFAQGIQSHRLSYCFTVVHNEGYLSGNAQSHSHFCLSIFHYPQWGLVVFFLMEEITFSVVSVEELWLQSNFF